MRAEVRFRAMGSDAHVVVDGRRPEVLLDHARRRIDDLERRWSRFRTDSEISRIAARSGAPCLVSDDTFLLIDRAVAAWQATAGRYDPTVGAAMVDNGYDRDFRLLVDEGAADVAPTDVGPQRPPGCHDVILDAELRLVVVPPGVQLDLGGIAKGLAADLVSAELLTTGADGVVVNLGGDIRVRGTGPDDGRWPIRLEDLRHPGRELLTMAVSDAGVASSSIVRRRWHDGGRPRHHVVDPRTGRPADTVLAGVTTITADAWWAEVVATEILLDPDPSSAVCARPDVAAVGIEPDGTLHASPSFEEVLT